MLRPEQRASLLAAKLRALVTGGDGRWRRAASAVEPVTFAAGSGLIDPVTATGWLLVAPRIVPTHMDSGLEEPTDPNPRGWLGGAMVLAARAGLRELHILLDEVDGNDARRATVFVDSQPTPVLWRVVQRSVVSVDAEAANIEAASEDQLIQFGVIIRAAGAELVVDHGVVRAEVRGLEVGRVVTGEDGVDRLDVGVGKHDRLANAMLGHDQDPETALRNAVGAVMTYRRAGAAAHPANQLSRERWLRDVVRAEPALAGIAAVAGPLYPIESSHPAALKTLGPALLLGEGVVVACSVGLDLDGVVDAADVRDRVAPNATIVYVIPVTDAYPAVHTIVGLVRNASLVTVPEDWPSLAAAPRLL